MARKKNKKPSGKQTRPHKAIPAKGKAKTSAGSKTSLPTEKKAAVNSDNKPQPVKAPAKSPKSGTAKRITGTMRAITGGFNSLDDFFFGSQTGAFERDEFDYDPFEDHSVSGTIPAATEPNGVATKKADGAAKEAENIKAPVEKKKKRKKKKKKTEKVAAVAPQEASPPEDVVEDSPEKQLFLPSGVDGGDSPLPSVVGGGATVAVMESIPLEERRAAGAAEAEAMARADELVEALSPREEDTALEADEAPEVADEIIDEDDEAATVAALPAVEFTEPTAKIEPVVEVQQLEPAKAEEDDAPAPVDDDSAPQSEDQQPLPVASEENEVWVRTAQALSAEVEALTGKKNAAKRAASLFELGRVLEAKLGDAAGAEARWNAALQSQPDFAPALRALVSVAAGRGDWSRVVDVLSRAGDDDTNTASQVTALLGASHAQLGELDRLPEAEANLMRVLELQPDNFIALRLLREIPYRLEDWEALSSVLGEMVEGTAGDELLRCLHERALLFEDEVADVEQAISAYGKYLDVDPHSVSVFLSLEGLLSRSGADAQLVELYQRHAETLQGAESSFWHARAARIGATSGAPLETVVAEFEAAVSAASGSAPLAEEFRHWLESGGHWKSLGAASQASLDRGVSPRMAAYLETGLGRVALQHHGDAKAALEHFSRALKSDPECFEAREGLRQGLIGDGRWRDLLEHDLERIDSVADSRVALAVRLGMAHLAVHQLEDFDTAEAQLRLAIEQSPNYLPALDALVTMYGTQGKKREQAEALESTAGILNSGPSRASYMLRAARLWADLGDRERSIRLLQQSSGDGPGPLLAREWLVESYLAEERWADAAESLRQIAAETEDPTLKVSLLYRSGQLALTQCDDQDAAEAAFRSLLDVAPDFLPAARGLRAIYSARGDWDALGLLIQQEAEGRPAGPARQWLHLSSGAAYERAGRMGDALTQYRVSLEEDPSDEVANGALRRVYRITGDHAALVDSFMTQLNDDPEPGVHTVALRVQLISTLADMGDEAGVVREVNALIGADSVQGLPLASLGIVCDRLQLSAEAIRAFAALADDKGASTQARAAALYHQGLLLEETAENPGDAIALYERADQLAQHHALALEALQRLYVESGDSATLASVYQRLADSAESAGVKTFYALLAGEHFEVSGDPVAAIHAYQLASEDNVGLYRCFDRLSALLLEQRDVEALTSLAERVVSLAKDSDVAARWMDLGVRLAALGEFEAALKVFSRSQSADPGSISADLHMVHASWELGDWNQALASLQSISNSAVSENARQYAEELSEELLAEKGVTSDGAFEFYQQLYGRDPSNAVALRGLGGIHFARNEMSDARKYYASLAEHAQDDDQKAEASTQVGLIAIEEDDDVATGVIHLEQALEFDGGHKPAISALKDLYSGSENWTSLVGVLAREASLAEPERRLPMFIEIAGIWQDRIVNPKVAVLSWKKVLSLDPTNSAACAGLLAIHEAEGNWKDFLDVADIALADMSGAELRDRQAELGGIAREKAGDDERGTAYLRAAADGDQPSAAALQQLREIARDLGDWEQLISLSRTLAQVSDDPAVRIALLLEAAELREDPLLDREGAAELFASVVEHDPDNAKAQRFFVNYWFDKERWGDAVAAFERYAPVIEGMDVDGNDDARFEATEFYSRYGVVLDKTRDGVDVREHFARALELTPTHLPSLQAIAPLYHDAEMWDETRSVCQSMLRLGGGNDDDLARWNLYLGRAELALDEPVGALKRFKKALGREANNIEALEGIAEVHWRSGDWNSLLTTYNSIIKHARDPEQVVRAYMTKGDVLESKLNFTDKAVLHFEKVLMYDKENVPAMARLGQIALRRGDTDRARKFAEQANSVASENDERAQGLLLERLTEAGDSVEVEGLIRYVREASGAGELLDEFEEILEGKVQVGRDDALDAYGRAFRRS